MNLPTKFSGISWSEPGWEFDRPYIMYYPYKKYGEGGNNSHFLHMVEDICIDITCGKTFDRKWSESDLYEFKWRGWSTRFSRRKNCWHLNVTVAWSNKHDFRIIKQQEEYW